MRSAIVTREWPPEVYGGAGVHVTDLVHSLKSIIDVDVYCMGSPRTDASAFELKSAPDLNPALSVIATDVEIAHAISTQAFDVVHSHTWYANFAGHLAAQSLAVPHVLTAHSLEPRRPWKAEQLGGGYRISSWLEAETYRAADAVIAVSAGMKVDVVECYPFIDADKVHVIHNGVDTTFFSPTENVELIKKLGIDPARPFVLFVGRITRQKGLIHLIRAANSLPHGVQLVLAASSPDEKIIGDEVAAAIATLKIAKPDDVVWLQEMLSRETLKVLLSHAAVFACPSIYEPLGIVNLEAMACGTAVVASAVGGIPEVVTNGVTGTLVDYVPNDIAAFEANLASALLDILDHPTLAHDMGVAGRARAIEKFGWDAIAKKTVDVYEMAKK